MIKLSNYQVSLTHLQLLLHIMIILGSQDHHVAVPSFSCSYYLLIRLEPREFARKF